MRKCDNCQKEIPPGADHIEVRVFGFKVKGGDFCKPTCFEEYYEYYRRLRHVAKRLKETEKQREK